MVQEGQTLDFPHKKDNNPLNSMNFILLLGIVLLLLVILCQPLSSRIRLFVNRTFFRSHYNYQKILRKYSYALIQPMTDLNRFAKLAPYLLTKAMNLSGASAMVYERQSHKYVVRAAEREAIGLEGTALEEHCALINELLIKKKALSLKEVEALARQEKALSAGADKHYQEVAESMRMLKAQLIIPSVSESQYFKKPTLLATVNLGKKLSKRKYSNEDKDFLKAMANQAAISVEYAFIFEELQHNQEQVVRSEKLAAIGTTTASIAHELKNPLTYINIAAQILPKKWDDPEFRANITQCLPAEAQRMRLIVEGLLDYSRNRELSLKPLEIKAVIEKTQALINYEITKYSITVTNDYQHTGLALADPNRLIQVFMNILGNAAQAMEKTGGKLTIFTHNEANHIVVVISDDGPGIAEEKLEKIFDPFFTTKEAGTGLGLAITKKIIEEHKGTISVTSKIGQGTTFTIHLPLAA